jgi:hypothetical protein
VAGVTRRLLLWWYKISEGWTGSRAFAVAHDAGTAIEVLAVQQEAQGR